MRSEGCIRVRLHSVRKKKKKKSHLNVHQRTESLHYSTKTWPWNSNKRTEERTVVKARAKHTDGFIQKVDDQGICSPFRTTYMWLKNETRFFLLLLTRATSSFWDASFQFQISKSAEMNWLKTLSERKKEFKITQWEENSFEMEHWTHRGKWK